GDRTPTPPLRSSSPSAGPVLERDAGVKQLFLPGHASRPIAHSPTIRTSRRSTSARCTHVQRDSEIASALLRPTPKEHRDNRGRQMPTEDRAALPDDHVPGLLAWLLCRFDPALRPP